MWYCVQVYSHGNPRTNSHNYYLICEALIGHEGKDHLVDRGLSYHVYCLNGQVLPVGVHQKENTIPQKIISVRHQLGHEGNLLIIGGFCYHASSIPYGSRHQNENMIPHKSDPNT